MLAPLNHRRTSVCIETERAFLKELDGSCRTPLAGHATLSGDVISFNAMALTLDGHKVFRASRTGNAGDAASMGRDAAEEIRALAGSDLVS